MSEHSNDQAGQNIDYVNLMLNQYKQQIQTMTEQ